ncbi:MAG TPA: hypothetical protein VFZ93_02415 [Albitalea sp.]
MSRPWRVIAFFAACLLAHVATAQTASVQRVPSRVMLDDAGVQLELHWTSPRGEAAISPDLDLQLQVRVSDRTSGQPLSGLQPAAWASRVGSAVAAAEPCTDRVKRLASGRLSARTDVDLNGHRLLTLNNDRSLSILDPQVRLGTTRLEGLVTLPHDAADWALHRDRDWVAVTLPRARQVALVDLASRRLVATVDTGGAGEPRRILFEPGSDRVWVGLDEADEVVAIDLVRRSVVSRIKVGAGLHALAFGADARTLLVTSSTAGEAVVVDTARGEAVRRVPVGPGALALAYSSASGHAYAAAAASDRIVAFDPADGRTVHELRVAPGVIALRADPSGRYVFALSERESRAWVLDTASGRVTGSARVADHPDQIAFTQRFAYVRGLKSVKVSLIDLQALQRGTVEVADIPVFRAPAASMREHINVADMIVPSPQGDGVVIAGTADTVLYSYMEGMMAPQGTFDAARRTARALMLVDRGLRETAPGTYTQRLRLGKPGRYVVPVALPQPRAAACVEVLVDGAVPVEQAERYVVSLVDAGTPLHAGRPQRLRLAVRHDHGRGPVTGLGDLQLMVLQLPGLWQQRQFAREVAPGVYEIEQRFPRDGDFRLSVQIASRGLAFGATGTIPLRVVQNGEAVGATP